MLEVNIWFPTPQRFGKRIKHGIFGPFFASEEKGENVGHGNLILSLDERSKIYEQLVADTGDLVVTPTLRIIPEIKTGRKGKYHAPKTVKCLEIDHSYWPAEAPSNISILKDVLHLMHLGKGSQWVPSQLGSHATDMQREDRGSKTSKIERRDAQYEIDKVALAKGQQEDTDLAFEISSLRTQLDSKRLYEGMLQETTAKTAALEAEQKELFQTYQLDMTGLKKQITQTNNKITENHKKILFLSKKLTYSTSISNPDKRTIAEHASEKEQLLELENERQQLELHLKELEKNLVQVQQTYEEQIKEVKKELNHLVDSITCLQKWIRGCIEKIKNRDDRDLKLLEEKYQQQADMTKRKEHVFNRTYNTLGLHSECPITLPTSESGLNFYIDEEAVIAAMQKEKGKKYSLVRNNCITSAKRCLLAGIKHLEEDLKKNGVPNSFFQLHGIETGKGFRTWTERLEKELLELNCPSKENSHVTSCRT
jgi:hypothetical protein